MKEITGNLRQDVKDLLGESASLFTGFFKRGVCTVRAVADKWKAFAHDISGTVDELMKPPFAEGGPEAPAPQLNSKDEPMVTVVESTDEHFPEKLQMPLSQAERRVLQISELYRAHNQEPQPVKVKIDYMKNGQTDRYFLPLQIGAGGSLLSQMREHISSYQANQEKISQLFHSVPDEYRKVLQKELTPFLHNSLDGLSKELLPYFQWHCGVGELGRQLEEQADMLPENGRRSGPVYRKPWMACASQSIWGPSQNHPLYIESGRPSRRQIERLSWQKRRANSGNLPKFVCNSSKRARIRRHLSHNMNRVDQLRANTTHG